MNNCLIASDSEGFDRFKIDLRIALKTQICRILKNAGVGAVYC
jgi:hypothetical protein